ncbi:unnamed protein product [Pneumocystis jirovecii]|uniref:Endocytosis protein 3 n=2 Tax=Pneumocystis jirovecii TaxID=42068 RepID=L0PEC7_PNEJI|nr:uncharacterized protein T551_01521 [Pneumocystis jirovecii RU7]KTW30969.1 hypothetical protein T551_01521 [Pneumocystis jirovecii RU7]CCJ30761.1 unnamed protein product [Pneumocystis jirovecii]
MEEITTEEQKKYWEIFISLNPKNGYLSGDQAADVLKNSKLSNYQLEKIWNLADVDSDGNLDFEEFCIAMRLIFDVINNVYLEVPTRLPDFLIPTSKAHLITARQAINENLQKQQFMQITDKTRALRYDFDWHIQPSDKQNYETIYTSTADSYGYISFDTLKNLYAILDISDTELQDAWKLVNPRLHESIDRDQVIFFLHILNQRNKGFCVPNIVPVHLKAIFEKSPANYNTRRTSIHHDNEQSTFSPQTSKYTSPSTKSDLSKGYTVKDSDSIEKRREQGIYYSNMEQKSDVSDKHLLNIIHELEKMLNFKKKELKRLKEGNIKSAIGLSDLESVQSDILMMKQQVDNLGSYLIKKTDELQKLHDDIKQETQGR